MSTKSKAAKNLSQGVAPKSRTVKPLARKANEPVIEQSGTKQSRLIALLQISGGCSIAQMTDLTGWQPHYADVLVMPTIIGNPACVAESAAMKSA